jgi:hypothetical protein
VKQGIGLVQNGKDVSARYTQVDPRHTIADDIAGRKHNDVVANLAVVIPRDQIHSLHNPFVLVEQIEKVLR